MVTEILHDNILGEQMCAMKHCAETKSSHPIEVPIEDLLQLILQRQDANSARREAKRARKRAP